MGSGLGRTNATITSAFRTALLHQGAIVLVVLALVGIVWNVLRAAQLRRALGSGETDGTPVDAGPDGGGRAEVGSGPALAPSGLAVASVGTDRLVEPFGDEGAGDVGRRDERGSPDVVPEPPARRLLRIAFGLIWVFDGLLQAQVAMPLGMTSQVIQPAASTSPGWVQRLVEATSGVWTHHPVTLAAGTVWIQVGVGLFLLVAPRGRWSRLAGLGSVAWGLVVWMFGEAFGGVFAPGLSWLFGAPGAALVYCLAGALVALPERAFTGPRLGRWLLRAMGAFFIGMAMLQAWPGRGFWQGRIAGHSLANGGQLTSMVASMETTPQPGLIAGWLRAFDGFDAAHGFAVNLFVVVALALTGAALCARWPVVLRTGVIAAVVLCLADWVLVQDFGFFGGVGTDPNSMVPIIVVIAAGYLGVVRAPASVVLPAELGARSFADRARKMRERLAAYPTYALRTFAGLGAVVVVLVGAVPMALASTNPVADPILSEAIDGTPGTVDQPAPPFSLTDQHGRRVSLASLRGRAVALTFLDPVCTSDCPLIAREFHEADELLGNQARRVELVAIVANPLYRSTGDTRAFDQAEGLAGLGNWLFLTGSVAALERAWNDYDIQVDVVGGGAMVAHSDAAYIIDPSGRLRYNLDADPGSGQAVTMSSFAGLVAGELRGVLAG